MKKSFIFAALAASFVLSASAVFAVTDSGNVTLNTTIASKAKLVLSAASVDFDDSLLGDPDAVTELSGSTPVNISAKVRTNGGASLTVIADNDFTGPGIIPVANVHTAADGDLQGVANFSKAVAATLGSGWASGSYSGNMDFKLTNSWTYVAGAYNPVSLTYTLTAP